MITFAVAHPNLKISLVRPGWVRTDMGGKDANLSPKEAAQNIYDHIENHKEKLPAGKLVGPDGDIIDF